ncbi:flagellar assembly peptidoglycan hydrolase FlgJ [Vibrio sp. SCSIO 43135]|uniref:flagellar assembly peptidoglycan hydrolase FlgJ n=1 Tax=Vibrio sp. SCSIO 43135 TaxID=2819096 RepID=UPI0020756755|nr:flagellar assembly peptidoglycan hydrolase FlgJ [Vibrio sp. SCSIO 43135]USD40450.1 flagellar assembly peptidoglycan hydrolase FlgJ [Vibrio sp. SCSIO 43135]
MINNGNDVGFVHDIASLDKLRQQAVNGEGEGEKAALTAAAKQFEAIFTSMLFKSMRDANSTFDSGLMNSQNEQFYRQMLDEQMASDMSKSGSLGLADMIVAQLSTGTINDPNAANREDNFEEIMDKVARSREMRAQSGNDVTPLAAEPTSFESPESFIASMKPYAEQAAKALGVDSSLLLAQAALETGWGQKVVKNSRGSSNNLFNIKADRSWQGDKVATQTLEYHGDTPVKEKAAFRSYQSYQDSFDDYVRFLNQNPRYSTALQNNGSSEDFIRGIHQAGYATDPKYADKVLRVKQRIDQM